MPVPPKDMSCSACDTKFQTHPSVRQGYARRPRHCQCITTRKNLWTFPKQYETARKLLRISKNDHNTRSLLVNDKHTPPPAPPSKKLHSRDLVERKTWIHFKFKFQIEICRDHFSKFAIVFLQIHVFWEMSTDSCSARREVQPSVC